MGDLVGMKGDFSRKGGGGSFVSRGTLEGGRRE